MLLFLIWNSKLKIEARNKIIKDVKRASNGVKNFQRFRNRYLFAINRDTPIYMPYIPKRRTEDDSVGNSKEKKAEKQIMMPYPEALRDRIMRFRRAVQPHSPVRIYPRHYLFTRSWRHVYTEWEPLLKPYRPQSVITGNRQLNIMRLISPASTGPSWRNQRR